MKFVGWVDVRKPNKKMYLKRCLCWVSPAQPNLRKILIDSPTNSILQELRKKALNLSVSDRLLLLKTITYSLNEELRPRPKLPPDFVDRMIGIGKTYSLPLNDA